VLAARPRCYARGTLPRAGRHAGRGARATPVTGQPASFWQKEATPVIPLLLWILGVPGLIIILLLLLGIVHL